MTHGHQTKGKRYKLRTLALYYRKGEVAVVESWLVVGRKAYELSAVSRESLDGLLPPAFRDAITLGNIRQAVSRAEKSVIAGDRVYAPGVRPAIYYCGKEFIISDLFFIDSEQAISSYELTAVKLERPHLITAITSAALLPFWHYYGFDYVAKFFESRYDMYLTYVAMLVPAMYYFFQRRTLKIEFGGRFEHVYGTHKLSGGELPEVCSAISAMLDKRPHLETVAAAPSANESANALVGEGKTGESASEREWENADGVYDEQERINSHMRKRMAQKYSAMQMKEDSRGYYVDENDVTVTANRARIFGVEFQIDDVDSVEIRQMGCFAMLANIIGIIAMLYVLIDGKIPVPKPYNMILIVASLGYLMLIQWLSNKQKLIVYFKDGTVEYFHSNRGKQLDKAHQALFFLTLDDGGEG